MAEIYLLTIGQYEGYEVLGVYEDRKDAEAAMEAINALPHDSTQYLNTGAQVEVVALNPTVDSILEHVKATYPYQV